MPLIVLHSPFPTCKNPCSPPPHSQQRRERQSQQQQKQRRRQQQQQQPGSDEEAEHNSLGDKQSDFPMGFGSVAVPKGCEVASVRAVLEATDYYKV